MEKALQIQKEVQKILGTEHVYLVGGSVRDLVMGNTPKDYDFCTPLLPDEMEERIKAAGRRVYAIGKQFGTIGFKVSIEPELMNANTVGSTTEDGRLTELPSYKYFEYVEVTTFRSEIYTSKSRKPEVEFVVELSSDLARRDFTMNAMVLKGDGMIFDPYGGKLDIHGKLIKTVGMPKDRIQEDPLRMLRAARFAARYGFTIDPNFIGKARQLADRIYDVSVERWVQELDKLLVGDYWKHGITEMFQMGVKYRIFPEYISAGEMIRDMPDKFETADEAWKALFTNLDNTNPKVARYMAIGICHRLKFSNDRTKIILDKQK